VPVPGPQNGRFSSEPLGGPVALAGLKGTGTAYNASVQRAVDLGETIKRIDGTEVPILTKWLDGARQETPPDEHDPAVQAQAERTSRAAAAKGADDAAEADHDRVEGAGDRERAAEAVASAGRRPVGLAAARDTGADDLEVIAGVGPKLAEMLHGMGIWHYDQIAAWGDEELVWVDENLEGFKGRASRDKWIAQARILANGGTVEEAAAVTQKDSGGN
ncbi:MAG: fused NADH-quinone oxidoreductase subunit E/endonuclease, partial [Paracoccus sp. (in: a-proteobacteria)]|nr:fused NADH-quinone oxidoreductase subunit E/endonuclease [Paracoccus sp. (in: a-proteobacteria)]